jgi:hypothetical protein
MGERGVGTVVVRVGQTPVRAAQTHWLRRRELTIPTRFHEHDLRVRDLTVPESKYRYEDLVN